MRGNVWILDSKQLALAREMRLIEKLPDIQPEEIDDKSKNTGVTSLIAILQIVWLAGQLIKRRVASLSSTVLEISTVAFSVGSILLYLIDWYKPMDMGVPFTIKASMPATEEIFRLVAEAAPKPLLARQNKSRNYHITDGSAHQTVEARDSDYFFNMLDCVLSLSSATFGGIHLIAWNYHFPTGVEQKIWRAAALTVATTPILWVLVVRYEVYAKKHKHPARELIPPIRWAVLATPYLLSRLFIIAEVLRSLYYLHPDAFVATWTANVPHIG